MASGPDTVDDPSDTIVAIATAAGRAGIGVVRLSGPDVPQIGRAMLGSLPAPRQAVLRTFRSPSHDAIDQGVALYFPRPQSFTGEDVLELQGHGGPVVLDQIVASALQLGARLAEPGEFTRRAFLNGKMDLVAAEAVADLIASTSAEAAKAAWHSLRGEFSLRIHALTEALTHTRMHVEAAIDFPEEEVDFLADAQLRQRIVDLLEQFRALRNAARQGQVLKDGLRVVIAGRPNAGKSSLLNLLAGYEAAIVTPLPGTTRDPLREHIHVDGMPLHIIDTAGLRDSPDMVEAEGIRRAQAEMQQADRILYLVDVTSADEIALRQELTTLPAIPVTLIYNKIDLAISAAPPFNIDTPSLKLSALTGEGLPELRAHLKDVAGLQGSDAIAFSARRRHLDALARAEQHAQLAAQHLYDRRAGELVADELRQAQICLGEITGAVTSDDLLGRIFSTFCIGK